MDTFFIHKQIEYVLPYTSNKRPISIDIIIFYDQFEVDEFTTETYSSSYSANLLERVTSCVSNKPYFQNLGKCFFFSYTLIEVSFEELFQNFIKEIKYEELSKDQIEEMKKYKDTLEKVKKCLVFKKEDDCTEDAIQKRLEKIAKQYKEKGSESYSLHPELFKGTRYLYETILAEN